MKYFLDTEFHEYQKQGVDTIELISIGIVCEDGREYYGISGEFSMAAAVKNEWLYKNVINNLDDSTPWFIREEIKNQVLEFAPPESKPEFYGYYADYDWVVFCWLFGRMIDLPDGYPMYCRDLKQMFDERYPEKVKDHPNYPKQVQEHNALADARWNYELYKFIKQQ